jgi:hypothetical protein
MLTGYWYNDSHRIAAMLPITGVPLAVAGVLFLTNALRPYVKHAKPTVPAIAVALTAVLAVTTGGLYPVDREQRIIVTYPRTEHNKLVTDQMRAFYDRIATLIPKDSVVIGNPYDGSVMLWALADRKVLYPHFLVDNSPDQSYLGRHLKDAATDPKVCAALARQHVEYVLIGKNDPSTVLQAYDGIPGVTQREGFQLVDHAGDTKLYRITACRPPPRPSRA